MANEARLTMPSAAEKLMQVLCESEAICEKIACETCAYMHEYQCALHSFADALVNAGVVIPVRCEKCRFSEQDRLQDPMVCRKWSTKRGTVYTSPGGYCHKGAPREQEG